MQIMSCPIFKRHYVSVYKCNLAMIVVMVLKVIINIAFIQHRLRMNTFPLRLNQFTTEGHAGWFRRVLSICIVVNLRFLYSLQNNWHQNNSNLWEFTTHCSLVSIIISASFTTLIIIVFFVVLYGYSTKDIKDQTISTLMKGWVKQIPLMEWYISVKDLTGDILFQQVIYSLHRYVYYK